MGGHGESVNTSHDSNRFQDALKGTTKNWTILPLGCPLSMRKPVMERVYMGQEAFQAGKRQFIWHPGAWLVSAHVHLEIRWVLGGYQALTHPLKS